MRIKSGVNRNRKRVKVFKAAKGYRGGMSKLYRVAKQQVMRSGAYAYVGRKNKKRDFRQLWITRINAEARNNGLSYSRMINGLKKANIDLDRKILADLAVSDKSAFAALAKTATDALSK